MLKYAEKLTIAPGEMVESDVSDLKFHKIDDGQILELNQIVGYFNYVNRLLNGLGVTTSGDTVGFYKD
jgi:alkylhydroperoxidase family enzyme